MLAASDFCAVEAVTPPVLATETREVVTIPAHKVLSVTPARYGSRIDMATVVAEHREGATLVSENTRVLISEPTRRLRAVEPVLELAPVIVPRNVERPRVVGGVLVMEPEALPPLPERHIVRTEARIDAVRINAGLRMMETQVVETDGDGDIVPAEKVEIEVRTVEARPSVQAEHIAAVTEMADITFIKTPSSRVEVEAVCAPGEVAGLLPQVQDALTARGIEAGVPGEWTPDTIDAIAAAQSAETGHVSPYLLVQTLRVWLPELDLPVS